MPSPKLDATELRIYAENDGAFFDKHIAPFMKKFKANPQSESILEHALKLATAAARSYWLELVAEHPRYAKNDPLEVFSETERKKLAIFWVSKLRRTPNHGL